MKKIILLAAAVVPLLASADVVNPTGSLYSGDKVILPPFASATWSNGSAIVWKVDNSQVGSQASKTATIAKLPGTYTITAGEKNIEAQFGAISNSAKVAEGTTEYLTSEDATKQINLVAPAWTNTHVGYAQLIKAANAPYSFTTVSIPSVTPSEDITVAVYESVEGSDDVITLGEPVAQLIPGKTDYYYATAPVTVSKDLIIVINGIEGAKALKAPANCSGAYYSFTYNNTTETNVLGLTPVPATSIGEDNAKITYNYALDITLGDVYTPFAAIAADEKIYNGADINIGIDFDNNVDAASYVGFFSCENVADITIEGQPSWLAVNIEKTAKYDDKEVPNAYVVTFSLPTSEHGEAWVKLNVPGATSPTFHITYEGVTGIEDIDAAATEVVAREYFDLQGRRLSNAPQSGIYIERATLANGKVTSRTLRR